MAWGARNLIARRTHADETPGKKTPRPQVDSVNVATARAIAACFSRDAGRRGARARPAPAALYARSLGAASALVAGVLLRDAA